MIGLTSLWINGRSAVPEEFNHRRAAFVLGRIDEILSWERTKEQERDVRFVELGEYLCEVRAKQYWRLENLKSFDEFLEKRFPDSRRKAYYLMAIHEHLPRMAKPELRLIERTPVGVQSVGPVAPHVGSGYVEVIDAVRFDVEAVCPGLEKSEYDWD